VTTLNSGMPWADSGQLGTPAWHSIRAVRSLAGAPASSAQSPAARRTVGGFRAFSRSRAAIAKHLEPIPATNARGSRHEQRAEGKAGSGSPGQVSRDRTGEWQARRKIGSICAGGLLGFLGHSRRATATTRRLQALGQSWRSLGPGARRVRASDHRSGAQRSPADERGTSVLAAPRGQWHPCNRLAAGLKPWPRNASRSAVILKNSSTRPGEDPCRSAAEAFRKPVENHGSSLSPVWAAAYSAFAVVCMHRVGASANPGQPTAHRSLIAAAVRRSSCRAGLPGSPVPGPDPHRSAALELKSRRRRL